MANFRFVFFHNCLLQASPRDRYMLADGTFGLSEAFLISPGENAVRRGQSVCAIHASPPDGDDWPARSQAAVNSSFEPNTLR
jgi:hypothetical protein